MKKLILSLLVSFLFVSCSKNKENTALENCATETMNISGSSHLWMNDEDFILLADELISSSNQLELYYGHMKARIDEYKINPPSSDWKGVYVAQNK